jgi:hypothetical protein
MYNEGHLKAMLTKIKHTNCLALVFPLTAKAAGRGGEDPSILNENGADMHQLGFYLDFSGRRLVRHEKVRISNGGAINESKGNIYGKK